MASIAKASSYMFQPTPAYKISKTALNMLTVQDAEEMKGEGFVFVAVNPGVCDELWMQCLD